MIDEQIEYLSLDKNLTILEFIKMLGDMKDVHVYKQEYKINEEFIYNPIDDKLYIKYKCINKHDG